jgi:cation diffusion facilitator family transporter
MHEGSRRAIVAAFVANLGIAIAKFAAFAITGAASLLAEAIHSVADTGNQGLLFLGGARSKRAPTETHQFGFGRERYFWAFIVALILFSMGSLFAIYEGIHKLLNPHEIDSPGVAFAVLGVAIVLESFSLRTAVHEASKVRGTESWWTFIHSTKSPELPVVLLEDVGALIGLMFALVGVSLSTATGDPTYDAVGSIAIGVLLFVIAALLATEMKSLLIGESASTEDEAKIRAAITDGPEVDHLIHLRTEHIGPDDLLVAAKVDLADAADARTAAAIDDVERRIRAQVPHASLIFIEPDELRPDELRPDDATTR